MAAVYIVFWLYVLIMLAIFLYKPLLLASGQSGTWAARPIVGQEAELSEDISKVVLRFIIGSCFVCLLYGFWVFFNVEVYTKESCPNLDIFCWVGEGFSAIPKISKIVNWLPSAGVNWHNVAEQQNFVSHAYGGLYALFFMITGFATIFFTRKKYSLKGGKADKTKSHPLVVFLLGSFLIGVFIYKIFFYRLPNYTLRSNGGISQIYRNPHDLLGEAFIVGMGAGVYIFCLMLVVAKWQKMKPKI